MAYTYTKNDILNQLAEMQVPKNSIIILHSSLNAVGKVEGGAEALLDALIEHITADGGLLCVPAHTWHNIGKEITLDMASNDQCLGAFATVALNSKKGIRSENPIHSLVVFGDKKRAEEFIKDEPFIKTSTGKDSCHGKLYSENGYVLLMGVAQNRNTYLHAVAEILNLPDRMATSPLSVTVKRTDGEIINREMTLYSCSFTGDISQRFTKYDTAFRYHRCITDGFIGNAPTMLCDAKKMADTIALIFERSGGIDPLKDEAAIPQKWYCNKD